MSLFILGVVTTLVILFMFGRLKLSSGRPVLERAINRRLSEGPYIVAVGGGTGLYYSTQSEKTAMEDSKEGNPCFVEGESTICRVQIPRANGRRGAGVRGPLRPVCIFRAAQLTFRQKDYIISVPNLRG